MIKTPAQHRQAIANLYEPSPETLAINKKLEPLGFDHQGDFYPVEFPEEEYKWVEIGCSAIAHSETYIAVLNYSIMEYWEVRHNSIETLEMAIKAVKEMELVA